MGMCADIVAIGPFSADVRDLLEYPATHYAATKPGAPVIVELFGIVEGSSVSRAFAACLGITDPWDFNQHKITPSKIDVDGLGRLFRENEQYLTDLKRLIAFRDHGFDFYFRPNG